MSHTNLAITVECYAGHRGEQEPRRLILDGRTIEVAEIVDRWLAPDYRYFKLRDPEGATWIVRHDAGTGLWELTMYERTPADTGPMR